MAYSAKILADNLAPSGKRLTTFEVSFPRIVLAEFNTHRVFSRNSASSRAIPVQKMLQKVMDDPFIPIYWGKNQKGMQAAEELSPEEQHRALHQWMLARDNAISVVQRLQAPDIDLHKQIANRLLEPWLWHTVIVTATEWDNFFHLRMHKDAQPEIRRVACMMWDLFDQHVPQDVRVGFVHLPLCEDRQDLILAGFSLDEIKRISVGRCARVSYLTHDGKRDPRADIELCARLCKSGHMSPLEHVATAIDTPTQSGNFIGWAQYRKSLPGEAVFQTP